MTRLVISCELLYNRTMLWFDPSDGMEIHGVLDNGTANVFFDPTGGGSWGISFSYAAGESEATTTGPPSFSLTWFWQLLPRHNQAVAFR
ncbi:hypothetical protein SBV1_1440047 [Verrucomicrobia bacterium]|nr:hypothetical protein SBV1_1440047 [Verrucomicrobiota bacterium]